MPGVVEEAWGTHTKGVGSTAWSEVRREEMSLQEVLFSKADLSLITHPPSLFPIPTYVPSRRKLCWACSQSFYKPHPPRLTVPLMWFNPNGPTFISLKKKNTTENVLSSGCLKSYNEYFVHWSWVSLRICSGV